MIFHIPFAEFLYNMSQVNISFNTNWLKLAPSWCNLAPCWSKLTLSWHKLVPSWPKLASISHKLAQITPMLAPIDPKMSQRCNAMQCDACNAVQCDACNPTCNGVQFNTIRIGGTGRKASTICKATTACKICRMHGAMMFWIH